MEYHHIGIPTTRSDPEEGYDPRFKYFSWGYEQSEFHIQWHRFEPDAPFHPKILTTPHIAFRVPSIEPHAAFLVPELKTALDNRTVILPPQELKPGSKIAFIEEVGAPIALIEQQI